MGKFPGRPYVAVIDVGGFWLGHLAMTRENDLALRKIEKMGIVHFKTSVQNPFSVTCNSLFVGLPLLQVRQSPCLEK